MAKSMRHCGFIVALIGKTFLTQAFSLDFRQGDTMEKQELLNNLRHSAAHLLAHAVQELFPGTLNTIGPVTDTGFFYDFLPPQNFKQEDLARIEEKMHEIAKRNYPIVGKEISKNEAKVFFKDNKFKLEIIDQIPDNTVGLYSQGDFADLCKGGHVAKTGDLKHFKLTSISGAYWRADREGTALQRISGICFASKEELDGYQQMLEDIEKYDHRKLGQQLELFFFHDVAPGMPFYLNKGLIVYNTLIDFMRNTRKQAYQERGQDFQEIKTPMILNESLWKTSGHYDFYKDHMYFTALEETNYCVKPMNCPGAVLTYKEKPHSYRELPMRMAEFGFLHRYELSGAMHGLLRVREFTMDDAHIFCATDQIEKEVIQALELVQKIYGRFNFTDISMAISTRPEKYMGSPELWETATNALKTSLEKNGLKYKIQEGEGAFYGPKIEVKVKDAMGREWQCGTVQIDFFIPKNFGLEYIDADQSRKAPVMIHIAIFGSLERFFGIILEHFKGNLPFWLAPVQARILIITDKQADYGLAIQRALQTSNIRVEMDHSGDQIGAKIRKAQMDKIPWMVVVGGKEAESNTLTLRKNDGTQEPGLTIEALIEKAKELENA